MNLAPGTIRLLNRLSDGEWIGKQELCEDKDGVTMDLSGMIKRGYLESKKTGFRVDALRITEKGRAALERLGG